jgi:hypothetical protein
MLKKDGMIKKIKDLPDILDYEEKDISHLSPRAREILYPERCDQSFTITIEFGPFSGPSYTDAVSLAKRNRSYQETGEGKYLCHHADYGVPEVKELFRLFNLVEKDPSCRILVNRKEFPYARTLWLPFLWLFLEEDGKSGN